MADRDAFDLFELLGELNKRDLEAFDRLTDEGKKTASPLVLMRWLTGTSDRAQIVRINTFANRYVFSLGQEKALLFKLLAASCTGPKRNNWLKGPSNSSDALAIEAVKSRFECSTREAKDHLRFLEPTSVLEFAEAVGWEKDQVKKLQVELGLEIKKKK